METSSKYLTIFFETLPIDIRSTTSSILTQISKNLDDVIPNKRNVGSYVDKIRKLRTNFTTLPFSVRKSLKLILLDGLEHSSDSNGVTVCIFTVCLCLLEFTVFRNCDRSDLESADIAISFQRLKSQILPVFIENVIQQRTNLPSLLSWSTCMLVFTFRACFEWIQHQDCISSDINFDINTDELLKHSSIPNLIRTVLQVQLKRRPYFIPNDRYTLVDLLFANAVSNNKILLNSSKGFLKPNLEKCVLEETEPPVCFQNLKSFNNLYMVSSDLPKELPSLFMKHLQSGSMIDIIEMLRLLYQKMFNQYSSENEHLLDSIIWTLKQSPFILNRIREFKEDKTFVSQYEEIYCLLLQLWFYAAERRILLTKFPQSYVWLVGFTQPNYALMSMNGFVQSILWTGRFLTIYQSLFRSSIMASPHWYMQMIVDGVIAVLDRSEQGSFETHDDNFKDALCTCILAISKPFNALRIEESSVREELSRVIKVPLELILARMAVCKTVHEQQNGQSTPNFESRSTINSRLRDLIQNHLIWPMIRASDLWALIQARIGMKPMAAKELLKQLLNTTEFIEPNHETIHSTSKLEFIKPLPAVGGLNAAIHKLGLKRKRL